VGISQYAYFRGTLKDGQTQFLGPFHRVRISDFSLSSSPTKWPGPKSSATRGTLKDGQTQFLGPFHRVRISDFSLSSSPTKWPGPKSSATRGTLKDGQTQFLGPFHWTHIASSPRQQCRGKLQTFLTF
jgi:hypothetical protein